MLDPSPQMCLQTSFMSVLARLPQLVAGLLSTVVWAAGINASEFTGAKLDSILENALRSSPAESFKLCAYTLRTIGLQSEMEERYDPYFSDTHTWSLVSVDGNIPTAEQLDQYLPKRHQRHPAFVSFEFIDVESIELVEQTSEGFLRFSFEWTTQSDEISHDSVSNTLLVDPARSRILEIRRESVEEFRVGTFLKVLEFETFDGFRFDQQTQSVVLQESRVHLVARSGRQRMDQSVKREFSELDCSTVPIEVPEDGNQEPILRLHLPNVPEWDNRRTDGLPP